MADQDTLALIRMIGTLDKYLSALQEELAANGASQRAAKLLFDARKLLR